jgi:branched-chain amino acid transport system permease protein
MATDILSTLVQLLNGIQFGFTLFLIASGLTVILGILDVLNLAHGELFAFGAYVSVSIYGYVVGAFIPPDPSGAGTLLFLVALVLLSAVLAAAVLVPLGAIIEAVFLRPLYDRDEVYQLVLTFALLLIIFDLKQIVWGGGQQTVISRVFSGVNQIPSLNLLGIQFPTYGFIAIVLGFVVVGGLFYFFNRTKSGRVIRATAIDREMATALGVSTDRTFTLVFALGAFLAGFAGAIFVPPTSAQLGMGAEPLVLSFVVIVIGGLGSLKGAFVGAIVVGVVRQFMGLQFPKLQLAAPFVLMIVVLLVKPEGLYGTWGERS